MRQANAAVIGMTRSENPITSVKAAEAVSRRKWTIRERVEAYAMRVPLGFIDEDLLLLDPDAPESSFRKRRSELTRENIILVGPEIRRNSKGQQCIVWHHRMHVHNPPPLKAREVKPSRFAALQNENARLRAEILLLKEHLAARHG